MYKYRISIYFVYTFTREIYKGRENSQFSTSIANETITIEHKLLNS